jgi:hypothetical protein
LLADPAGRTTRRKRPLRAGTGTIRAAFSPRGNVSVAGARRQEGSDFKPGLLKGVAPLAVLALCGLALAEPLPPDATYRPLPTQPFEVIKAMDEAEKPEVMQRQRALLEQRYDLADRPMPGVMMSGGRRPVQEGVRVRLPANTTWDDLAAMTPGEIRAQGLLPEGFKPLPHVKQATGGQVFPDEAIEEICRQEGGTCAASTSTWTCPSTSGRSSRRRSS